MGNKMKKLLCALLASAMLVTSMGAVSFAAPEDEADTAVVTAADDSSTADLTDEEKEAEDATAAEATEAPAADAEATEAPAAEAATPAPEVNTVSGTSYDNDAYYQKALALCSSLGIISGYEDGSVRPESKVTRAEMASIVLRMLATGSFSKYQNIFTDVTDAHWAADQIQTAYEGKVISGMGDGTFAPDSQVTYAQVIVMLVNACGYHEDAEYYGGWQQGYIKAAGDTDLNLLKNAPGYSDEATDRGIVIKMVYNALLGDYKEITAYEGGQPKYTSDRTLAEAKFDVIEQKGVLLGTAKTSIDGDVQDGQVLIKYTDNNKNEQKETYDTTLKDLEEYIAQKITYYYRENSGTTPEVVAVTYDSSKSETYEITDLDTIEYVKGFEDGAGEIKIEKVSKAKKTADDVSIVYNGKLLDPADVAANGDDINDLLWPEQGSVKLVKTDKNDDAYDVIFVDSYETVVVTSATDTKLIGKIQDPDKEVGVTKGITYNLDDKEDRTITATKAGSEIRVRNLKKNDVASVKASYPHTNPEVIDIIVSGDSITGSATSISTKKMDKTYATINGQRYDVANVAAADLQAGTQCTFYLDIFGKIAYIEGSTGSRLGAGEKYGWIMAGYNAEDGDGFYVKLMTEDGAKDLKLANKVDYWAPSAEKGSGQVNASEIKKLFNADETIKAELFPGAWSEIYKTTLAQNTGKTAAASALGISTGDGNIRLVSWSSLAPVTLVKFKTNSSGNITRLYCGVSTTNYEIGVYDPAYIADWTDATWDAIYDDLKSTYPGATKEQIKAGFGWKIDTSDGALAKNRNGKTIKEELNEQGLTKIEGVKQPYLTAAQIDSIKNSDALILDMNNKKDSTLVGGLVGGYVFSDDIPEFGVPKDVSEYTDADAYAVKNVTSAQYNQRENGLSDDFFIANPDGTKPGAVVRYIANGSKPVNPADMDNVSSPTSMIVDSIDVGVDNDDNTIYVINGYLGGSSISVTTKNTSALAELTDYVNSGRNYGTSNADASIISWGGNGTVWESGDEDTGSYLTDYLHEGDIIITDGTYILIYASAQEVYTRLRSGQNIAKNVAGSNTRTYYWFNQVTDSDFSDTPWMAVGGNTLSADASMPFDIVEIDLSARDAERAVSISDDLASIADVEVYDADQTEYDYAYAKFANKGSLQEVIIYRIKNADYIGADAAQ